MAKAKQAERTKAIRTVAQQFRADESWPLYDTVLIGRDVPNQPGWFSTFEAFAQETEISFFNRRNRSQVGPEYCNLDTSEQLDFAYMIHSIGVDFIAPPVGTGETEQNVFTSANSANVLMWGNDLLRHSSLQLILNQDEKLNIPCSACPSGIGPSGTSSLFVNQTAAPPTGAPLGPMGQYTNGVPHITNRWPFPQPIRVPRNHNLRAVIKLSEWARFAANRLEGPVQLFMGNNAQSPDAGSVPAVFGIRVTLIGNRFVQLRNAQSFY
jgi:hypothetical protein